MIVIDTSAVLEALVADQPDAALVARLMDAPELHAPHLIDVEVLHVLRRLAQRGEVTAGRAAAARQDWDDLQVVRYPHVPLADRIWDLRDNLTAYDACFVALAEALDVPLVTTDGGVARAPGVRAQVEVHDATG